MEPRTVLSANGLGFDSALQHGAFDQPGSDLPFVQTEGAQPAFSVVSITLRVNDDFNLTVDTNSGPVLLQAGDSIQVVGIDYEVGEAADGLEGVIAAEGYIHKLGDAGPGAIDYSDGRFGGVTSTDPIASGTGWHAGLDGTWTVDEGWGRMSLVLIRYYGDESAVAANYNINLQVGEPDFHIAKHSLSNLQKQKFRVGKTAEIQINWMNSGTGRFHTYFEMDVYHESDLDNPVWVGVSVATLGSGESVSEVLVNENENDPFARQWTPERAGSYLVLIDVDPEQTWQETSEGDNRLELWVTVKGKGGKGETGKETGGKKGEKEIEHISINEPTEVALPNLLSPSSSGSPQSRSDTIDPLLGEAAGPIAVTAAWVDTSTRLPAGVVSADALVELADGEDSSSDPLSDIDGAWTLDDVFDQFGEA